MQFSWVLCFETHECNPGIDWARLSSAGLLGKDPLPTHLGCWQNSFSCGGKTEVPGFLLAVGRRLGAALSP